MPDETRKRALNRRRYQPVIEQCRDTVMAFCDAKLAQLFESAGAALLDFANRAESDAVQSRFFEAMGQFNRRRGDIEQIFGQEINQGFDQLGSLSPPSQPVHNPGAMDGIELSLLEPEEVEESVAAENLILRANASYFPELYALSQRLGVIKGGAKLKDFEIPGGPHHLVSSYRRAIEGLDVDVRVKIILYALFDKFVLKDTRDIYDTYNNLLIGAGILPELKPVHIHRDPAEAGAEPPREAGEQQDQDTPVQSAEPQSLGAELFNSILDMMSTRWSGRAAAGGRAGAAPSREESELQTRELLSAISNVQSQRTAQTVSAAIAEAPRLPSLEVDVAFVERVKESLALEREQILSSIDQDKLAPMDSDLIDLIGMLFEYMLNDPILPNVAKALLSHLHTPYLKVALIDRRLLVDAGHPARRLLDQMVEAGSQWVDEANPTRGIFPAMEQIVDRVLQEFNDDVGLFGELLDFLDEKIVEQQRRSDTTEQRTQEAARGREKLALAKQRAAREIRHLTGGRPVPKPVAAFLSKTWLDHLVFIVLRDEEQDQGHAWRRAVKVAEQLVALFDPQSDPDRRRAHAAALPRLRDEIAATAQRLGSFNSSAVAALLALLDSPESWQSRDLERAEVPVSQTHGFPSGSSAPNLTSTRALDEDLSEPEREMVERLGKMRFGTWFEFTGTADSPPRRIKLSWVSPLTSTCMFVNRAGMQAETKSLRDLAQEILAGGARVIPRPKHPFIDRALVSIHKILERGGGESDRATETPA